jgi:hypothetical protein
MDSDGKRNLFINTIMKQKLGHGHVRKRESRFGKFHSGIGLGVWRAARHKSAVAESQGTPKDCSPSFILILFYSSSLFYRKVVTCEYLITIFPESYQQLFQITVSPIYKS